MKRLFSIIAVFFAIVPPLLAQESEAPTGFSGSVSAIGRLDANPYSSTYKGQNESGFSFSNTSLYTLVDLQFNSWMSFSMENHWLSFGDGYPANLYKMTGHSDYGNWLDWAYVKFATKNDFFNASLGKVVVPRANTESLEYDFNQFYETASSRWNFLQLYQWGTILELNPLEGLNFTAGITTSPYGEYPFKSGLFTYSGMVKYNIGGFGIMGSYSAWQNDKKSFTPLWSLSLNYENDRVFVYNDFESKAGINEDLFADGVSNSTYCKVNLNDSWSVAARFNYDYYSRYEQHVFQPAILGFFEPLEGLRIHALTSCWFDKEDYYLNFNIGITYNFTYSF